MLPQELNSYFISHHLRGIVTKSVNGESLSNNDRMELVRVAINYLILKNGPTPSMDARKSIAHILHVQFPGLDVEIWCKKLTQRIKNLNRKKTVDERGHIVDFASRDDQQNEKIEYLDYENIDDANDAPILIDDDDGDSKEFDYETYEL